MSVEHPTNQWAVVRRTKNGRPHIVRFRESVATWEASRLYPVRFLVHWDFKKETENDGLPNLGASADMAAFEAELLAAIDQPGTAVFTMVTTHDGVREWIFHAVDIRKVVGAIETKIDVAKRLPVRLDAAIDPSWSEFRRLTSFASS